MGMRKQTRIFVTMEEKKIYDLANCQSQKKKQVKAVQIVNYNINAANRNVLTMMQYVHSAQYTQPKYRDCRQIIRVDIEVETSVTILCLSLLDIRIYFCVNTMHEI